MDSKTTPEEVEARIETIKADMPETYAAIKRKAGEIGAAAFALVRRGLRGEAGCFYALERGHVVGTPFDEDSEIMGDVARWMVQFGCTFVVIWPRMDSPDGSLRTHAAFQSGRKEAADGAH